MSETVKLNFDTRRHGWKIVLAGLALLILGRTQITIRNARVWRTDESKPSES